MIDNSTVNAPAVIDVTEQYALDPDVADLDDACGELEPAGSALDCRRGERGMVTAEWAIGIIAAVSLAGIVLYFIVKGPLRDLLTKLILNIIQTVAANGLR